MTVEDRTSRTQPSSMDADKAGTVDWRPDASDSASHPLYDIAIVGYGPVGSLLANLMALNGCSVVLVEQSSDIYDKPRAIVLDHEALRVLQLIGLGDIVKDMVSPHAGTTFVGIDGEVIKNFDPAPPPFPLAWFPTVMFIQPEMEKLLREQGTSRFLKSDPTGARGKVTVLLEHRVMGLDESADSVSLHLQDITGEQTIDKNMLDVVSSTTISKDGKRRAPANGTGERKPAVSVRSRFVVGADGGSGNSIVRKCLKIPYTSLDFDEWWIVIDTWLVRPPAPPLPPKSRQFCWPSRPGTFIIGPRNLRRWEIKLLPGEEPGYYMDPERGLERIHGLLKVYVEDVDAVELWRAAVYRFHALVAQKWSSDGGRVFLAGDAAHQMPPFLGQGLCAGFRDAVNLSWKLSHHLRHTPTLSPRESRLLATYERERSPHVTTIVGHAKQFGLIIGELDHEKGLERDRELRELMRTGKVSGYRQAFIPDLDGGMVSTKAPGAGRLFPQPHVVDAAGQRKMMDDCLPRPREQTFVIVADSVDAMRTWLSPESEAFLRRIGAQLVVVAPKGTGVCLLGVDAKTGAVVVEECETVFADWLAKWGGSHVVLGRPDRCYAFGAAVDAAGLYELVGELREWFE